MRLPTRDELVKQAVLLDSHSSACVLCFQQEETCQHLFYSCGSILLVWKEILEWMGASLGSESCGAQHFLEFSNLFVGRKNKKVINLMWVATPWCSWRMINDILFNGGVLDLSKLVNNIKTLSWIWFINRAVKNTPYVFSIRFSTPIACLTCR